MLVTLRRGSLKSGATSHLSGLQGRVCASTSTLLVAGFDVTVRSNANLALQRRTGTRIPT